MARNIEIKARLADPDGAREAVAALADRGPIRIAQDDSFFHCENGRLKLRAFDDGTGELIFYRRADQAGPKESFYVRSRTADPDELREALALAYGIVGRVRKLRSLYWVGRTRVHLDRVDDLGEFLELEVVLAQEEPAQAGIQEARELITRLGIAEDALIDRAYVDLLSDATCAHAGLPGDDQR
ncbi:MAG: class IV adenylate cyclase [Burkholderiaceae bacterium]